MTADSFKILIFVSVAVVVAFFLCWAPFHAQRLLAVYLQTASEETQDTWKGFYVLLLYASGILYYLSTTINPVLYNIMSNKFRDAFKVNVGLTFLYLSRESPAGLNKPKDVWRMWKCNCFRSLRLRECLWVLWKGGRSVFSFLLTRFLR